jgi:hypothetical protein
LYPISFSVLLFNLLIVLYYACHYLSSEITLPVKKTNIFFNGTDQRRTKQDSKTSIKSLTHVYLQCYDEYIKTAKLWSKQDTLDEIKWCMNWGLTIKRLKSRTEKLIGYK